MASSLSNLVDNLTEGIHKIKCKDCYFLLEYESVKDSFYKICLSCNEDYSNRLDEKLKKLKNTFTFSNNDMNKFILLLRKSDYPYEYMDDWAKFHETTLPDKKEFMEEITDADCMHRKGVCKDF